MLVRATKIMRVVLNAAFALLTVVSTSDLVSEASNEGGRCSKVGELIGYTTGTPTAHNRDFVIQISDKTACPFSVLGEPHKSTLLSLLGPKSASPNGPPTQGTGLGVAESLHR